MDFADHKRTGIILTVSSTTSVRFNHRAADGRFYSTQYCLLSLFAALTKIEIEQVENQSIREAEATHATHCLVSNPTGSSATGFGFLADSSAIVVF
jgi:hypothetical protein